MRTLLMVAIAAASLIPAEVEARAIDVICRAGWGARRPTKTLVKHAIKRMTVHHSGARLRDNRRAPQRIRGAQRYHQGRSKGWADIAYHYLIDLAGNVYEGRPAWARGDTGTNYDPTGHLLVCVVGDYGKQKVAPAQVAALVDLLAWGARRFKVSPATIRGHSDHAATSCPGRNLQRLIKSGALRRRVEARQKAGGVSLRLVCGAAAKRRVAQIERTR